MVVGVTARLVILNCAVCCVGERLDLFKIFFSLNCSFRILGEQTTNGLEILEKKVEIL